jgi:hypothetical protein
MCESRDSVKSVRFKSDFCLHISSIILWFQILPKSLFPVFDEYTKSAR